MENTASEASAGTLGPRPARRTTRRPMSRARRTLLELLEDQVQPTSLAALVAMSGMHENTIREHLAGLAAADLVTRERAPVTGRGRPAWLWSVVGGTGGSEYAGLAAALAETLHHTSTDPAAAGLEAGRAWGRERAHSRRPTAPTRADGSPRASTPTSVRREVVEVMDDLGFAPEANATATRVRLTRCPLLEVARKHSDIVCNVHLGLVQGALDEYGSGRTEASLVPFAEPGCCVLRLRTKPGEHSR